MAFPNQSYVCKEIKKWLGEGQKGELLSLPGGELALPKDFTVALACVSGARTVQPSAGTSKGWKTQAITLVLSFRLAGVPGLWKL